MIKGEHRVVMYFDRIFREVRKVANVFTWNR